jgi:hypothetical protein
MVDPMRKYKVVRNLKIRCLSDTMISDAQGDEQTHSWNYQIAFCEQEVDNGCNARQASNKDGALCGRRRRKPLSVASEKPTTRKPPPRMTRSLSRCVSRYG